MNFLKYKMTMAFFKLSLLLLHFSFLSESHESWALADIRDTSHATSPKSQDKTTSELKYLCPSHSYKVALSKGKQRNKAVPVARKKNLNRRNSNLCGSTFTLTRRLWKFCFILFWGRGHMLSHITHSSEWINHLKRSFKSSKRIFLKKINLIYSEVRDLKFKYKGISMSVFISVRFITLYTALSIQIIFQDTILF